MEHAYKHVDGYQHVDDVATGMGCDFDALMLLLFGMAEGCGLCGHCVCAALEPANWLEPAPWMVMAVSEGDLSGMAERTILRPDENRAFATAMWACCLVAGTTGPSSAAPMIERCSRWLSSPAMAEFVEQFDLPEGQSREKTDG